MSDQESKAIPEAGERDQPREAEPQNIGTRAISPLAGADFITAFALMIFGVLFFIGALNMKIYQLFFTSPGFFPMILGVLFIMFGFVLLYTSSKRGGFMDAKRIISGSNIKRSITSPVTKKWCVVFLLILCYVALLGRKYEDILGKSIGDLSGKISFEHLSMAYLFLTFLFLKAAKWYWIILISVMAPMAVQYVFVNFFRIPMP